MRVTIDRLVVCLAIACIVLMASFTIARSRENHGAEGEGNDDRNATAINNIDCSSIMPFSISQPGRYFLAEDLKQCDGISISASSVRLELRGHTIQQANSGDYAIVADGMTNGLSDLEIEGPGTLTGGFAGINFANVHRSRVRNLVVVGNGFGIQVQAGDITNPATFSTENEFRDNVITANSTDGINVQGGNDNRFIHSNLSGNGDNGLVLVNANNNVVRDNTAAANGLSGINIGTQGSGNRVDHNTALGNGIDLNDDNSGCDNNMWTNNSFNGATSAGLPSPTCIK